MIMRNTPNTALAGCTTIWVLAGRGVEVVERKLGTILVIRANLRGDYPLLKLRLTRRSRVGAGVKGRWRIDQEIGEC